MSASGRLLPRLRPAVVARTVAPRVARASTTTIKSQTPTTPIEPANKQSHPIGAFYQAMIDQKLPDSYIEKADVPVSTSVHAQQQQKSSPPPKAQEEPPVPSPPPAPAAAEKAAGVTFASTLLGPKARSERLAALRKESIIIAGVAVPPKPDEPDNCCMSGCVNCVYDTYREELEEWSAAKTEAERRLRQQEVMGNEGGGDEHIGLSMDEDGGGLSEAMSPLPGAAKAKDGWDEQLYADLPVGIREFMKTEKKLKDMHKQAGTAGG